MVLLTLDASSSTASVCVTRDDALLYESYLHNGRMHAAVLLPMVEDALRCAVPDGQLRSIPTVPMGGSMAVRNSIPASQSR